MNDAILVDATKAARLLAISERAFHDLRRRPDFPRDATVHLGPRAVRFRVVVLERFCAELAAIAPSVLQSQPDRLRQAREKRRAGIVAEEAGAA